MKILITGTHGTGKSTLLGELKKCDEFKNFKFIGGVTREAKSFGFPINERSSNYTQLYCACSDVLNLLQSQERDVIFDRNILDTWVYTKYLERNLLQHVNTVVKMLFEMFEGQFDLIFWLRPEFEIEDDGVRGVSESFQADIDYIFEYYFHSKDFQNLCKLSGSVQERVEQAKNIYNERKAD